MKAFIIYLEPIDHNKTIANQAMDAAKLHNIDAVLYQGVHGKYDAPTKLMQYNLKLTQHKNRNLTDGEIGCLLSHYELWQKCVDLNEPIMILEPDGIVIRSLPDNILENFSEVLHLDPVRSKIQPFEIATKYQTLVNDGLSNSVEYFYANPNGTDVAGPYLYGTYGYCIKPLAASKLIKFIQENGVCPSDVAIGKMVVDVKSTTQTIVKIHDSYTSNDSAIINQSLTSPYSLAFKKEFT